MCETTQCAEFPRCLVGCHQSITVNVMYVLLLNCSSETTVRHKYRLAHRGGRYSDIIHTYLGLGSNCEFQFGFLGGRFVFWGGGVRKINISVDMKILWIFFGVITKLDYI